MHPPKWPASVPAPDDSETEPESEPELNLPHEKNGPDGELHIGVNLGIDWYVSLIRLHDKAYT